MLAAESGNKEEFNSLIGSIDDDVLFDVLTYAIEMALQHGYYSILKESVKIYTQTQDEDGALAAVEIADVVFSDPLPSSALCSAKREKYSKISQHLFSLLCGKELGEKAIAGLLSLLAYSHLTTTFYNIDTTYGPLEKELYYSAVDGALLGKNWEILDYLRCKSKGFPLASHDFSSLIPCLSLEAIKYVDEHQGPDIQPEAFENIPANTLSYLLSQDVVTEDNVDKVARYISISDDGLRAFFDYVDNNKMWKCIDVKKIATYLFRTRREKALHTLLDMQGFRESIHEAPFQEHASMLALLSKDMYRKVVKYFDVSLTTISEQILETSTFPVYLYMSLPTESRQELLPNDIGGVFSLVVSQGNARDLLKLIVNDAILRGSLKGEILDKLSKAIV